METLLWILLWHFQEQKCEDDETQIDCTWKLVFKCVPDVGWFLLVTFIQRSEVFDSSLGILAFIWSACTTKRLTFLQFIAQKLLLVLYFANEDLVEMLNRNRKLDYFQRCTEKGLPRAHSRSSKGYSAGDSPMNLILSSVLSGFISSLTWILNIQDAAPGFGWSELPLIAILPACTQVKTPLQTVIMGL